MYLEYIIIVDELLYILFFFLPHGGMNGLTWINVEVILILKILFEFNSSYDTVEKIYAVHLHTNGGKQ